MNDTYFEELVTFSAPKEIDGAHIIHVQLNPAHEIFNGHFPEKMVLPGVVMIEIVKRAVESIVHKDLIMQSSSNIKFLKIIAPDITDQLGLHLGIKEESGTINVKASLQKDGTIYFKERAVFIER